MNSQFSFLAADFPQTYDSAFRAEALARADATASCFYSRRTLEQLVTWVYQHDKSLELPYRTDLSALIHEPTFRQLTGEAVFQKCRAVKDLGNHAVHSPKRVDRQDAVAAVRELFHICYWLARMFGQTSTPPAGLTFDAALLPATTVVQKSTIQQLQAQAEQNAAERDKLFEQLVNKDNLDEELKKARTELAAIKKANEAAPDTHNYSEAETRDLFVDLLLKESGWKLDKIEDREYQVAGMPNLQDKGFVDYVLWGDDGKPLGLVEAKRTRKDARIGQQQAKLYADCLESETGQRPIIFYTNGYEHWIWDDHGYPPRPVQGFYKKAELELLIQRRSSRRSLASASIDAKIIERHYQTRAIRRIGEAFEKDHARKALLVMATGSGKTRTVIALVDQLMRANWAKRILFLADRTALVKQAVNAFKAFLPESNPVNLVTEPDGEGRVYVSTYPTMLGKIDATKGDVRPFGVGHFDLVIIDEAHRSVFMKYRSIFDYFDSYLVGLTATPKNEVDKNTYSLFDLEEGVPTDAYPLSEAIADGFLVPARSVSVPLKLPTQGLTYDQLSDEEKDHFELTDWKERATDVIASGRVEAEAVNKWLFNKDTVDKVLKHLMERGLKVDGGDKLGKTIIFAKNHDHAVFIADRFDRNYPKYAGSFARVIDYSITYAQSLIDDLSDKKKMPQIAVSVDMLDTGIDIPEIVNLVFFKQVRSKTKFWQMVGRGTRLCPDLFGPGQDKESFYIFDYCRNLEFFKEEFGPTEGNSSASLSQRLFASRLRLLGELAAKTEGKKIREHIALYGEPKTIEELFRSIVELLKAEVGSMNTSNFIVRAKRRLVEKYQDPTTWADLTEDKLDELELEIAGLPAEKKPEPVESKQFDLLMLRLQQALLKPNANYGRIRLQLQEIAASLEESSSIPLIKEQISLIEDVQTDEWWQDVTLIMLEQVRLRLRALVPLIEHRKGSPVYTDFRDEMGDETEIDLPQFTTSLSLERFREKARAFLLQHLDKPSIQKLRLNLPIGKSDLRELEQILQEAGATDQIIETAFEGGLGLFVRSLIGLDRAAAKSALAGFEDANAYNSTQIEFVNLVIDYLTERGTMAPGLLYASPFTDLTSQGPEGLFEPSTIDQMIDRLRAIEANACAAGIDLGAS